MDNLRERLPYTENATLMMYDTNDAENELLANIRRSFFTNGRISRKKVIVPDKFGGEPLTATYSMSANVPMHLSVKRGRKTVMRSNKLKEGMYAIEFFTDSGALSKTCVFSANHEFFKILYFAHDQKNSVVCELLFKTQNGENAVIITESSKKPVILYPFRAPYGLNIHELANDCRVYLPLKLTCAESAEFYASRGDIDLMLFQAEEIHKSKKFVPSRIGFGFTPEGFSDDTAQKQRFDLESAANKAEPITNAYVDKPKHEKIEIPEPKTELVIKEPEITKEPIAEEQGLTANTEAKDFTFGSPEKPDCVIKTANEKYLYYGEVDDNGDRTGIGRTAVKSGAVTYYGGYFADKRNGFGAYYYKSGKPCYFGKWKDNMREGVGTAFRSNGEEIHSGNWHNDKAEGLGVRFDENGTLKYISNFKDGKRDGICLSFDSSGNLVITKWKNGEQLPAKRVIDLNDL